MDQFPRDKTATRLEDSPRVLAAVKDLCAAMPGAVVTRNDVDYSSAREISNRAVEHYPLVFALCETVSDVQAAINICRKHDIPLSVRSGGHDWAGRALRHDGCVIDLRRMKKVEIDARAHVATVQGGATTWDLIDAASSHGLVAVTGMAGEVGVTGLALGGGYGSLIPRYGLASDNLVGAEVVLSDGRCVKASTIENADLLWALRGGGGNFGVVTSIQLRLHTMSNLLYGPILFPWSQAETVLQGYVEMMAAAPDELAVTAGVSFGPDGNPVVFLTPTWIGERLQGERVIAQLQGLGTPIVSKVGEKSYADVLRAGSELFAKIRNYVMRTRWQATVTAHSISEIVTAANKCPSPQSIVTLQSFHGAASRVRLDSSAFGLRERHFMVLILAAWEDGAEDAGKASRAWGETLSQAIAPDSLPGGYANLLGPDDHEQIDSAYGGNAERLKRLKNQFDPDGVFLSAIPVPGVAVAA